MVIAVTAHGSSFWTQTAKLEIELADGTLKSYFLKVSPTNSYRKGHAFDEYKGRPRGKRTKNDARRIRIHERP